MKNNENVLIENGVKAKDIMWTQEEETYLRENINKLSITEIYAHFLERGRTQNCVNIKAHRLRLAIKKGGILKEMVSRNLIIEMLTQRIGSPESFRFTPEFRERTGIGQKRFWQLYRGEKNITEAEYRACAREWKVTIDDAFEMGQLTLIF